MSPRRNTGQEPTRSRSIARVGSAVGPAQPAGPTPPSAYLMSTGVVRRAVGAFAPALALAVAGLTVACADGPTAPAAGAAPSLSRSGSSGSSSTTLSQTRVGDTVVTRFVVGTDASRDATFDIGDHSEIAFPYAAGSICDPARSTYGSTEWDKPCPALTSSVEITAKQWYGADGLPRTDFQPALRFVPGLRSKVTLSLRDREGDGFGPRIDFCTSAGCVDEAAADPTLRTHYDSTNGWWYRTIKHFSGYTVVAN